MYVCMCIYIYIYIYIHRPGKGELRRGEPTMKSLRIEDKFESLLSDLYIYIYMYVYTYIYIYMHGIYNYIYIYIHIKSDLLCSPVAAPLSGPVIHRSARFPYFRYTIIVCHYPYVCFIGIIIIIIIVLLCSPVAVPLSRASDSLGREGYERKHTQSVMLMITVTKHIYEHLPHQDPACLWVWLDQDLVFKG